MFGFVLSGATFISRHFLEMYYASSSEQLKAIRQDVSTYNNCEDIVINWIVSYYYPELLPVVIKGQITSDVTPVARSHKPIHTTHRSDCFNSFTKIFGINPLRYAYTN